MGWKGMAIGGSIGSLFGGPLGAIIGAALGHQVEAQLSGGGARHIPPQRRSLVFCMSAAAMLAKLAKADGIVTRDEIASVEDAFRRLGFSRAARLQAIDSFRRAKDDSHTIYEYARDFAAAVESVDVRELFYELLWDLACADGTVSEQELQILRQMPHALRIRGEWFAFFASRRLRFGDDERPAVDRLAEAYATLGASQSDSVDELRRKYRDLAKRNHPDSLRAQGLPEEMIGKATERMSRINEAWAEIRSARGI